jgi:hypothetical protein
VLQRAVAEAVKTAGNTSLTLCGVLFCERKQAAYHWFDALARLMRMS